MKRILFLILLPYLYLTTALSQEQITLATCLPIQNSEDSTWITRYEKEIQKLEEQDKTITDFHCDALFLGSSSFRMWDSIHQDLAPLNIVNRGYGGASIRDLLYNYSRITGKYQPRNILFYSENDIIGYKTDISISETYDLHRIFFEKLRADFPDAHLYILSIKPSGSREKLLPQHRILNQLFSEYARQTPNATYLDVATPLLSADGEIRPELYRQDKLHLNADGYAIWTNIIKPRLLQ